MQSDTFTVSSDDGVEIFTYRWRPEADVPLRAAVQVAHGMAEHAGRYARFAEALTAAGFAVYANDHRGHGRTAAEADHGYFADADGWFKVAGDLRRLTERVREDHPGAPVFLFGHSMGSFLVRTYVIQNAEGIAGAILSGTGGDPGLLGRVGLLVARTIAALRGPRHPSVLLDRMSFGSFNKAFAPARTPFDWLSRDPDEVDKYVADPLCGNVFTAGFFADLLTGLAYIHRPENVARVPRDLPMLLFSGDQDPVGDATRGVQQTADAYRAAGLTDVTVRFYPGGRHEMLNETNRDEVTADVRAWIEAHLPG